MDRTVAPATAFATIGLEDPRIIDVQMAFRNDSDDVVVLVLLVFDNEHRGVIIVILSKVGGNF